ncbi:VOC family protein [Cellulomonas sp. KRMCY2]|uniref:VOC family protein n=1 Tax=Cellulomonas sp. KRMCY2 TaxID=1304865 RepID=UPI00045E8F28|nr:VOC family protein [Cellulomonas sp. KRMCY2]
MAHGDITHIDIPVADLGRATSFYNGLFGWDIQAFPGFEGYPMWRAPNGVSGGGLAPREEGFTAPRSYVEVESIDDTLARVVELGGQVKAPKRQIDPTSWWASIEDLDGNEIGLYEGSTATE